MNLRILTEGPCVSKNYAILKTCDAALNWVAYDSAEFNVSESIVGCHKCSERDSACLINVSTVLSTVPCIERLESCCLGGNVRRDVKTVSTNAVSRGL